jgi:putative phage-type endonuclease
MEIEKVFERHAPKTFNKATLLHTAETGSKQWATSRQFGIGGSEVGAILGLNSYKSAFTLWAERTGLIDGEIEDNWAMRLGREFEEPILKIWAEDNPDWAVYRTGTYSSNEFPFMQASPDALAKHRKTGEWVIVEIKTARFHWSELPPSYRAQVIHYMTVMGLRRAVVVAVAGWDPYEEWIELDDFEASAQNLAVSRFWNLVETKTEPDFDGADNTYETVRRLHPDIDADLEVEIDGLHNLALINLDFETAKASLNKAKSEVLQAMGKAKSAYIEIDGEKHTVATRRARGDSAPFLVIQKLK